MPTRENQFVLFEGFSAVATRAPKLELPFQRKEEIDLKRAQNIFGVSKQTMRRMLEQKLIRAYRTTNKQVWRIEYASVVEYCDRLRVLHCISDSRAGLTGGRRRYRDEDLLPFPMTETIFVKDVQARLDCDCHAVVRLIQTGALTGYQLLFETPACPWRIHEPSLDRYIESLHAIAAKGPSSRVGPSAR